MGAMTLAALDGGAPAVGQGAWPEEGRDDTDGRPDAILSGAVRRMAALRAPAVRTLRARRGQEGCAPPPRGPLGAARRGGDRLHPPPDGLPRRGPREQGAVDLPRTASGGHTPR